MFAISFRCNIDCVSHLVGQLNDHAGLGTFPRIPVVGEEIEVLDNGRSRLSLEVVKVTWKPMAKDYEKKLNPYVEIELGLSYTWKTKAKYRADNEPDILTQLAEFIRR